MLTTQSLSMHKHLFLPQVSNGPASNTLQFIYQLSIPLGSPDSSKASEAQGIWAVVITTDGQTLVQNFVENQHGGPSSWFMKPIYCCRHACSSPTSKQKLTQSSSYSILNNPVQGEPSMCHSPRNPADGLKQSTIGIISKPPSSTILTELTRTHSG
jgi:hypothetical protein